MSYTIEDPIEPFWAEYSAEAGGRDPLAIQNSSVVIYTKMSVGITNVTTHVRYNGFFCWLFDTIGNKVSKNNSIVEQIRLSRRAELLLAYIMVKNFPNITGVSGSDFASKNLREKINLRNGADWESKPQDGNRLYWKSPYGIFGQYYSGAVNELDLINNPNPQADLNIYALTEKGSELSKHYEDNIPQDERELFWVSIKTGLIKEDDLAKLKSFDI